MENVCDCIKGADCLGWIHLTSWEFGIIATLFGIIILTEVIQFFRKKPSVFF